MASTRSTGGSGSSLAAGTGTSASPSLSSSRMFARLAGVGARCSRGSGGAATLSVALLFFFVDTAGSKLHERRCRVLGDSLHGRHAGSGSDQKATRCLLLLRLGSRGLLGAALGLRLADFLL